MVENKETNDLAEKFLNMSVADTNAYINQVIISLMEAEDGTKKTIGMLSAALKKLLEHSSEFDKLCVLATFEIFSKTWGAK